MAGRGRRAGFASWADLRNLAIGPILSFVNITLRITGADDDAPSSNPLLRNVDRTIDAPGLALGGPQVVRLDPPLPAGGTLTAWDGSRATGVDGTTQLALATSPLAPSRYRLSWTAVGTNPAFRTERALGASGHALTLTLNANLTVTVTGVGPTYTNVQVGDQVVIPGAATGDTSSPFSPSNVGYWTALASTSTSVTLVRAAGWTGGASEVVSVTTADQVIAMSPDRVQAGDQVSILGGFSTNARRQYQVVAVTPRWIDVLSTVALAHETAVMGSNGFAAYAAAKRLVYAELDQLCAVQLNGDAGTLNQVDVLSLPSGKRLGLFLKSGPAWKCVIVNQATVPLGGVVIAWP